MCCHLWLSCFQTFAQHSCLFCCIETFHGKPIIITCPWSWNGMHKAFYFWFGACSHPSQQTRKCVSVSESQSKVIKSNFMTLHLRCKHTCRKAMYRIWRCRPIWRGNMVTNKSVTGNVVSECHETARRVVNTNTNRNELRLQIQLS